MPSSSHSPLCPVSSPTSHLLCTKHFTNTHSFTYSSEELLDEGAVKGTDFQTSMRRLRNVKGLAESHLASCWYNENSGPRQAGFSIFTQKTEINDRRGGGPPQLTCTAGVPGGCWRTTPLLSNGRQHSSHLSLCALL